MEELNTMNALRQSVLFQHLPEEGLSSIAKKAKIRQFFPEETIVWQGKPSDSLYLIVNGIVTIKKIISNEKEHILAYLMPGHTFGEVGILENQPRSATVVALSDVEVIVVRRQDFLELLQAYPTVAIELAKMLGRYLLEANRRISQGNKKARLVLLISIAKGSGGTSVGNMLARMLVEKTRKNTLYTEYPAPENLAHELKINQSKAKIYHHPSGYDLMIAQDREDNTLPNSARTTLLLDDAMKDYENIVICLPAIIDKNVSIMLDYANQIIIMAPPVEELWHKVEDVKKQLKRYIRPEETIVFTILNRSKREYQQAHINEAFDFELPYVPNFPLLKSNDEGLLQIPSSVAQVMETFVDRLERTHQIGIFIPTTIDVDQHIDTSPYVQRTLAFLAERFGGATTKQAQGVWNSDKAGLVDETVYIVHAYVTHADMNAYLDEVIEYIKQLKVDLKQEAMALEVDRKLTLI